jgi:hypothetical protein
MWVPLKTYVVTVTPGRETMLRKGKNRLRDKISESLMRMLSGISAAIFDLMSKLSRSCPPTSCLPTAPDPLASHSASTAVFLSWISWDPVCSISLKARSRARERRVGYKKMGQFCFHPTPFQIRGNAYDEAEDWEEELESKNRRARGGERQNRADGPVNVIILLRR